MESSLCCSAMHIEFVLLTNGVSSREDACVDQVLSTESAVVGRLAFTQIHETANGESPMLIPCSLRQMLVAIKLLMGTQCWFNSSILPKW